jgi:hypothetical protein
MSRYGAAIFNTTSAVMQAEKALLKEALEIKIIPTPREFSRDCGISIRFDWTAREQVEKLLQAGGLSYQALFPLVEPQSSQGGVR